MAAPLLLRRLHPRECTNLAVPARGLRVPQPDHRRSNGRKTGAFAIARPLVTETDPRTPTSPPCRARRAGSSRGRRLIRTTQQHGPRSHRPSLLYPITTSLYRGGRASLLRSSKVANGVETSFSAPLRPDPDRSVPPQAIGGGGPPALHSVPLPDLLGRGHHGQAPTDVPGGGSHRVLFWSVSGRPVTPQLQACVDHRAPAAPPIQ